MTRASDASAGRSLLRPFGLPVVHAPTGTESAAFDARAISELSVPRSTLMENAGRSAAEILTRLHPRGRVIGVIGPGNNGGDGLVLLRTLAAWGRPVEAIVAGERPGAEELLHRWDIPVRPDTDFRNDSAAWDVALSSADILVDALLGTGLQGAPRARQGAAIAALGRSASPVLSLDVPSGIDADSGYIPGDAVRAAVTVAFGFPKLGSLLHPARAHAGRIVAVEIGFPPVDPEDSPFAATLVTPGWSALHRPRRRLETHKRRVGSLLILAGSVGMAGAAVMAARGAFRAGVGVLRVASPPANRVIVQASVPEAIFVDSTDRDAMAVAVEASDAVVAGPGLGTDENAAEALRRVLDGRHSLLLDAGALTLVGSGLVPPVAEIASGRPLLLTPHAAEMERISKFDLDEIRACRPDVAREAAADFGCSILLKGAPSVLASPDGRLLVDTVGNSDLATAGMGDVLAGVAAGFLARGCAPEIAGGLALHHTGRAAVLAGKGAGLIPSDVIERLPEALLEEGNGESDLDLPHILFDQDAPR